MKSEDLNHSLMIRKILLFVYIVLMLLLVLLPLNDTELFFLTNTYVIKIRLDYIGHILLFLPFLFLVKQAYAMPFLLTLLAGLVFAGMCEGIQYLLPYRSFNINDLLANIVGTILGIVVVVGWNFLRQKTSTLAKASVNRKGER